MIKIEKEEAPCFWKTFQKKNPKVVYRQLEESNEGKVTRHNLRKQMIENQYYICGYCCRQIDLDNSLIEHIQPEDLYPDNTMDYQNLIVSCKNDKKTCGPKKANRYDENLFVSPLDDACETHFAFFPNGDIVGLTEQGEYTIKLLGLDSYKLCQARAAVYQNIQYFDQETRQWYLTVHDGRLQPFVDAAKYYTMHGMI